MVFATDFDSTDFDSLESSKRHQPNLSEVESEVKTAKRTPRQADLINMANISPAKQTQHLIAQANQARKQTSVQANVQAITQASALEQGQKQTETEAAIAAFQRDARHAKRADNVLSLHPDGAPTGRKDAQGNPITRKPSLPVWLSLLTRIQQGSTVVTGLLMTGALVLYGSSVYVDRSTNTALVKLDALQGESQELTAANEAIKQSLAEQATREDSGLELYEAGDVLFVKPEPLREAVPQPEENNEELVPLGY